MYNWPTKEHDLQIAQNIIEKYIDLNAGEQLEVVEYIVDGKLELKFNQPGWVVELIETFQKKYGKEQGVTVAMRLIAKYMINDATIH